MFPAVSLDVAAALKTLVLTLDLVGTFVFALSGATAGVRASSTSSACWCCPSWPRIPAASCATS
jgi:uncharacterized membrane protein YeiH